MFERFTDRARKVLQHAQVEAQRLSHMYVGTQHVLLGLIKEGSGVAGVVLLRLGCDLAKVRATVQQITPAEEDCVTLGRLPRSPNATLLTEYAIQIALERGDDFVGTEHLLLGLLRLPNCTALVTLRELAVSPETVQTEVCQFVPHLEIEPTVQALIDATQAVELVAAGETDTATQRALQLAADVVRRHVARQQEELVVSLPSGRIRAGCDDWADPDAVRGDYLAVDTADGTTVAITAADLVCQSPQQVTQSIAAVVHAICRAGGDNSVVCPPAATPPVHLMRWSIYQFVRWLAAMPREKGAPCNNSVWSGLTVSGPRSSSTTAS